MKSPEDALIQVPEYIKGLIFDCDGTLVDSMPLHMEAWENAIRRAGGTYDYDFFFSKKGLKEIEIINLYNAQFHAALNGTEIVEENHEYFYNHIQTVKPLDAVVNVVYRYSNILPMAVVSGSAREIVTNEIRVIGIDHLLKILLTADDLIKQKPASDMFLEVARRMGIQPLMCQVFEDGDLGLLAARNAGMIVTDVRPFVC